MAIEGRPVQRSPPVQILPFDRCPLRNESLGFCRLSPTTGIKKFLVDVQNAFQCAVSACSRTTSAASYLCNGTRSRGAATLTDPNLLDSSADRRRDAGFFRGFFLQLSLLVLPAALPRFREGCVLMSLWREPVGDGISLAN